MAYQSLSRQYRPQTFGDVHGQEHVTRTLQNALTMGRLAQAYLFCGPRGVGKTTVARILAKALNCHTGPTAEPCGECDSCRRIVDGSSLSVIEIDAASHRSIDDIRSLREDVQFAPTDGRRKVYILDEAHQITGPAFEAFLKTLEEPPAHVVFVLATTEAHKIPATILSRCQRFDFRRVPVDDIVDRLAEVAEREGLTVEPPALYAIARAADGGLRDALSILDQLVAFAGETVTATDVDEVLGTLDQEARFRLGDILATGDVAGALAWLGDLLDAGRDARLLVDEALSHCRLLLLARLAAADELLATLPDDIRRRLAGQAERFDPPRLMAIIEGWAACHKTMRWHPQPRILLEVTLIDLLLGEPEPAHRTTTPAPPPDPAPAPPPDPAPAPPPDPAPAPRPTPSFVTTDEPPPAGEPLTLDLVAARLDKLREAIRAEYPPLAAHLTHVSIDRVDGDQVVFVFHGWEASLNLCLQERNRQAIERTLGRLLGRPVRFTGELGPAPDGASATEAPDLDEAVALTLDTFPGARELEG